MKNTSMKKESGRKIARKKEWTKRRIGLLIAALGMLGSGVLGAAEEADDIVIIGGADGPTSIFVAGKLEGEENLRPGILDTAVPLDENGVLSYLANDSIEENLMQELAMFGNELLVRYDTYDSASGTDVLHLRLLSLETGEVLCETSLATGESYTVKIQVCKEKIAVCDAQNKVIHVLDSALQEERQYEIEAEDISGGIYTDADLSRAYCITQNGIWMQNLNSGEMEQLLENARDLAVYSATAEDLCICYVDVETAEKKECYAGLNLTDSTLEVLEIDSSFGTISYHEGIWAGNLQAEDQTYVLGTQQELHRFSMEDSYPMLQLTGSPACLTVLSTQMDGTQQMTAYDTNGVFLSSFSSADAGGTLMTDVTWLDETGCFVTAIDESGHDRLYFWDLTKECIGENLELTADEEKTESTGEVLEAKYYEAAAALSDKYGPEIKIADQCDCDYSSKTAQMECDTEQIEAALEVLDKAFSAYPEGFFEQLYYGAYRTMEIHLVGAIEHKEKIEGHIPSAFVQQENGKIIMVLNITESAEVLEQNFYHESSHIIDQVLEHDAQYREDACFSEERWQSLNPETFLMLNPQYGGYYESYEIMPMTYYQEEFTPYFVIDYGKSFATEDRATIFEAAMMKKDDRLSADGPLHEKLEYYCQCIRDCFDTTGWGEETAWEAAL